MTYYDGPAWSAPGRQPSWDQPAPPSRSGASSAMSREDTAAFASQFEEVERAIDNLSKGGKLFVPPGRRESMPMGPQGRPFNDFDPRMGPPQRHHSVDFDPARPHSASNVQGFYANQRFQPRHNEADQMQQAKRRMAAQRERELRNYHQEQQYNRNVMADVSQSKSDRSNSPSVMNEEERRELISRQHKALYGNDTYYENGNFGDDSSTPRPGPQGAGPLSARGHSPMAFNNFGGHEGSHGPGEDASKGPSPNPGATRSRSNSNSSPASNANQQNFAPFDPSANLQQSSRTSTSSPGASPPRQGKTSAPAPIGTRPTNPALNKRATPPASSPLSFGFVANDNKHQGERASSAASNPVSSKENSGNSVPWGSSSGVWNKGGLGGVHQASVWG